MNRAIIFDEVKRLRGGKAFSPSEVASLDRAIDDALGLILAVRRINAEGLALIKQSEGLRLNAYRCPADVPTIGYGSTGPNVRMGMTISAEQAEALLLKDLSRFEVGVAEMGGTMTDGQFAALVSFAFNLGLAALSNSTLLKKHLAGDYDGAALEFPRWTRGGGRILPGLVTRRNAELRLYKGLP